MALRLALALAQALVSFVFGFSPPLLSVTTRFTSLTSASRTPSPIFAITWLAIAVPKFLLVEMQRVEMQRVETKRVEMKRVEMTRAEMTRCAPARAAADALSVSAAPCPGR